MVGCPSWFVVSHPLSLDPTNGVFGRFDFTALLRLPHLKCSCVSLHMRQTSYDSIQVDGEEWRSGRRAAR